MASTRQILLLISKINRTRKMRENRMARVRALQMQAVMEAEYQKELWAHLDSCETCKARYDEIGPTAFKEENQEKVRKYLMNLATGEQGPPFQVPPKPPVGLH